MGTPNSVRKPVNASASEKALVIAVFILISCFYPSDYLKAKLHLTAISSYL